MHHDEGETYFRCYALCCDYPVDSSYSFHSPRCLRKPNRTASSLLVNNIGAPFRECHNPVGLLYGVSTAHRKQEAYSLVYIFCKNLFCPQRKLATAHRSSNGHSRSTLDIFKLSCASLRLLPRCCAVSITKLDCVAAYSLIWKLVTTYIRYFTSVLRHTALSPIRRGKLPSRAYTDFQT